MTPSPQQQRVYDWVTDGSGHAIVISVAGSGKTTTLIESLKRMRGYVTFAAYNRKIADEIIEKVNAAKERGEITANVRVNTFHAIGFGAIRKLYPETKVEGDEVGYKTPRILEELQVPEMYHAFVKKAVTFAKQRMIGFDPDFAFSNVQAWRNLVDHFDLEDEIEDEDGNQPSNLEHHVQQACNWTVRVIKRGIEIANEIIDFEDMIYLAVRFGHVWQQNWVLVDEAQDTNPARRAFARKLLGPGSRSIWVGDPGQAIYGFTGADSSSLAQIKKQFNCTELPLTVSFRCPQNVVNYAKQWNPLIEATSDAPEGEMATINSADLLARAATLSPEDSILCRNNAPLVELALGFIKRGIACHVEGREIGAQLCKLVTRWKSVKNLDQLVRRLEVYKDSEVSKLMAKGKEMKAETLADTIEALLAITIAMPNGSTLEALQSKILGMFQDTNGRKRTLTLSTVHKSKGREWKRVFWYGKNKFQPSPYARQDWQVEQEKNLCYVAATRAMASLTVVNVPVAIR